MRLKDAIKLVRDNLNLVYERKHISNEVRYLSSGSTRYVYEYGKFVIKVNQRLNYYDDDTRNHNRREYDNYKNLCKKYPHLFARTLWISDDSKILVMEKITGCEPTYKDIRYIETEIYSLGISDTGTYNFIKQPNGVIKMIDYAYSRPKNY